MGAHGVERRPGEDWEREKTGPLLGSQLPTTINWSPVDHQLRAVGVDPSAAEG